MFKYYFLIILSVLVFTQCTDPVTSDVDIETLLSAPESITVENKSIVLSTYMWRDFQPDSPADGKPLIAIAFIETADGSDLPSSINAESIYLVYNNEVWESALSNETPAETESFRLTRIARNGPKWGPGAYVDVIVSITYGSNSYLLRAANQYISRTD